MTDYKATSERTSAREANLEPLQIGGRRVSQKRSQVRVEALLSAADQLLRKREVGEIGIYDVAHLADVPPASAYHFFPTKESVLLALAERYLQQLHASLAASVKVTVVERWPDYIRSHYDSAVAFFNGHVAARKLLLGAVVGSEIKNLDLADIDRYTAAWYDEMNEIFVMPYVKDAHLKFTVLVGIYDGIWQACYAKYGHINAEFAREGLAAGIAYLETFLPKTIPLRDPSI
ncbi:MAG TPA: TetR/AcrR family transcriptional regulator [Steroidobacteraceae bacterium]